MDDAAPGLAIERAVGRGRVVLRDGRRRAPLLFDPLGVPGELEGRAGDRETLIVLTNQSHERAARRLVERLEHVLPPHGGPPDRPRRSGGRSHEPNPLPTGTREGGEMPFQPTLISSYV